jgi:hypothetical protein
MRTIAMKSDGVPCAGAGPGCGAADTARECGVHGDAAGGEEPPGGGHRYVDRRLGAV